MENRNNQSGGRRERGALLDVITENTVIPLGLVCVIISGVFWLASVSSASSKNASDIADMKLLIVEISHQREEGMKMYKADMMDVSERLGNIEGALGVASPRPHGRGH